MLCTVGRKDEGAPPKPAHEADEPWKGFASTAGGSHGAEGVMEANLFAESRVKTEDEVEVDADVEARVAVAEVVAEVDAAAGAIFNCSEATIWALKSSTCCRRKPCSEAASEDVIPVEGAELPRGNFADVEEDELEDCTTAELEAVEAGGPDEVGVLRPG